MSESPESVEAQPQEDAPAGETATSKEEAAAIVASETGVDGDVDGAEESEVVDDTPIAPVLEAILFAAAEPVPLQRLSRLFQGRGRGVVKKALEELRESFEESGRGIRLVEVSSGYQLRSAPAHAPWLQRFFAERPPRLSRALLETVAIVAYRQPVTRGEIEAIRGVNCDAILTALVNRDLIMATGRRDTPGRPVEYGTTRDFLELFTMKDLGDLPELPDAESLASLLKSSDADVESGEGDDDSGGGEAAEPEAGEVAVETDAEREQVEEPVAAGEDAQGEEPRATAIAAAAGAGMTGATVMVDTEAREQEDAAEGTDPEDSEPRGDRVEAGGGGPDS